MKNWKKRVVSSGLALAMGLTSTIGSMGPIAFAQDDPAEGTAGDASALYEPWKHGYRLTDVLNWDPSTDPFAEQLRARVPLQERNDPFAATQANPNLESKAQMYNTACGNYRSTDVSNAPWNGNLYYDEFAYQCYKFWQYTDIVGAGGRPTSGIERGESQKEYGVIGIPIAAYTNAAHKNGVKTIAEYFFPRNPQYVEEWLYKDEDGNFPYAQKLVDLKEYYGFDGYFINNEVGFNSEYVPVFKEMLAWMRSKGVYIQMYDGITDGGSGTSYQNRFNSTNSSWVLDDTYGRVSDSLWVNYFYYNQSAFTDSVAHAQSKGLDPFEAVFFGVEAGNGRFIGSGGNGASSTNNIQWIKDETGNPTASIATWGNDFTLEGYNTAGNNRYKSQYQWQTEERERMWFTSPSEDATDHTPTVNRPDVEVNSTVWRGISDYISERSVINGSAFTTNFNNGHGMQYFQDGAVSRDVEWANMNLQDLLPTWQWWIQGEHKDQLDMDWDYGPTYTRILAIGKDEVPFDYQQIGAYNGGSSLVTYGDLEGTNFVNLYKTDLAINANSKISLTYNKPSADDGSTMQLGLVFKNNPETKVYLPIEDAGNQTDGWKTVELSLADYAGEDLAAIGIELSSDAKIADYQVNFGQIKVTDGTSYTPDAPTGFGIDQAFDETGEIELSWDLGSYGSVKQYHVYAGYADGSERFVGGAYADNLYISTLEDRDNITSFKLRAVGKDGSESEAAVIAYNNNGAVSNIRAKSENNKLNVTWEEADGDYASVKVAIDYFYSDKEPSSVTVDKGAKNAQLDIPLEDGSRYTLTVETVKADGSVNDAVNYFGTLADNYCEPYSGDMRFNQNGSVNFSIPASNDWSKLYLDFEGSATKTYDRFSGSQLRNISIPAGCKKATVTVEDRYGNKSMPIMFIDGKRADLDAEITAEFIPDDVLRAAIMEKVGPTLGDVLAFTGELDVSGLEVVDLTGINLMTGLTGLDISGTQVSDLAPIAGFSGLETLNASNIQITSLSEGMLPASLVNINLSGNEKLEKVNKNALSSLKKAESLDISDNTALSVLYLNGMQAASIDIGGCNAIAEINAADAKIENLDLAGLANLELLTLTNAEIGELALAGCTGLAELYATGIDLNAIDLSGLTGLKVVKLNGSTLEKISCADTSALSNMVSADISGAKLDMSEGTPERAFADAVNAITANKDDIVLTDPAETNLARNAAIVADQTTINAGTAARLFDGQLSYFSFRAPNTIVCDLGTAQKITSWKLYNDTYTGYGLTSFEIYGSNDAAEYTLISSVTGNSSIEVSQTVEDPQYYRYYKLNAISSMSSGGDMRELELYGHNQIVYKAGIEYGNQRPVAYLQELPEALTVTTNKTGSIRLMDYFESCYDKAETVRGTLFSSLEGAEWIAADYSVPSQIAMPGKVYVEIIDEDGNIINAPEDTGEVPPVDTSVNIARNATVLGGVGQNSNERYDMLFDGEDLTKWCTNGSSGWMAFCLPEEASVGKWITKHAEINSEPASFNTEDFELQILNTEAAGMSEDEFLALSASQQKSILSNGSMWISIDHVTGNKSMIVDRDVEDAPEAKVYRLMINKAINGTDYSAIRVHELELYEAENTARDYDGVLALDKVGLYNVNFKKGKTVLASMDVRVRPVTSLLEDIIAEAERLEADGALKNTMEAVVNEFNAALQEAKDLLVKEGATQKEINDATLRLLSVIAKVDWKQGDKTVLEIAVELGQNIRENIDLYVEAGKQEFLDALAEAEALLASGNAWQDDIDNSVTRLTNAMKALRMAPNKDILNGMIANAKAMDLSAYTADSANAVRIALAMAQAVAADPDATQEAVDAAANTLDTALKGLVVASGDANANTDTPVGEGTKPTKTGDNSAASLALLALLSAGAVALLKKRTSK